MCTDWGFEARDNEILVSLVFVLAFNVFNTIVGLPFSVYSTFVVEQKHGFNNQTAGFYLKDQIKKFIVAQVLIEPTTNDNWIESKSTEKPHE